MTNHTTTDLTPYDPDAPEFLPYNPGVALPTGFYYVTGNYRKHGDPELIGSIFSTIIWVEIDTEFYTISVARPDDVFIKPEYITGYCPVTFPPLTAELQQH